MSKLGIFVFFFSLNLLSSTEAFDESKLYRDEVRTIVIDNITSIHNRFYEILARNIVPDKNEELKKSVSLYLKTLRSRISANQDLTTRCALKVKRGCIYSIKSFLYSLDSSISHADHIMNTSKIVHIKRVFAQIKKMEKKQWLYFQTSYFNIMRNKSDLTPDFLDTTKKFVRDSMLMSIEQMINLTHPHTKAKFAVFFHNFLIPTQNVLNSYNSYKHLIATLENFSRTLYDFSFYMDKLEKVSATTKQNALAMTNQWNLVKKHLVRR